MDVIIVSIGILILILFPSFALEGALAGLRLCGITLIPTLLPFLILTGLLSRRIPKWKNSGSLIGIPSHCLPPLGLSFIGGYPAGVSAVCEMYEQGKLTKTEAQSLIPLCNNSGPGFFVGALGIGVFSNGEKGLQLFLIHVFSAILVVLLTGNVTSHSGYMTTPYTDKKPSFSQDFQDALEKGCTNMVRICGLVTLFSCFGKLLTMLLPRELLPFTALAEISSGLLTVGAGETGFLLWSFLTGWGGLCVHMQAMSLWKKVGLEPKGYFPRKLLHGSLSILCAYAIRKHLIGYLPVLFLICYVFFLIRKNWGRKKRKYEV